MVADNSDLTREQLIDFLNSIANAYRAGLTLPMAFRSFKDFQGPVLRKEIELSLTELQLGSSEDEVLCAMANRTKIGPLYRALRELIIGRFLGTPIEVGFEAIVHDLMVLPPGTPLRIDPSLPELMPPKFEDTNPQFSPVRSPSASDLVSSDNTSDWTNLKLEAHQWILESMDIKKLALNEDPNEKLMARQKLSSQLEEEWSAEFKSKDLRARFIKEVIDEALGLGPLEDLLADDEVEEILVNSADQITFDKKGKRCESTVRFSGNQALQSVIERIMRSIEMRADETQPFTDGIMRDGVRVTVVLPPVSSNGPVLLLRKSRQFASLDLLTQKFASEPMIEFLRLCVIAGLNIIVSSEDEWGGSALLHWLTEQIPKHQRVVLINNGSNFKSAPKNWISLQEKAPGIGGQGGVSLVEILKITAEFSPDRVVSDCGRNSELIPRLFLDSSMGVFRTITRLLAGSPRGVIAALENHLISAGTAPNLKAAREIIASGSALIVQCSRFSDGTSKVTHITSITGMIGDSIAMQDIFIFKQEGLNKNHEIVGRFVPTGIIPQFVEDLELAGFLIPRHLFTINEARQGRGK